MMYMLEWMTAESQPAGELGPWTWAEIMERIADGPRNGFSVRPADEETIRAYDVVWGGGTTATPAGVVGTFTTREEAERERDEFLARHSDNPAVGAWVEESEEEPGPCPSCGGRGWHDHNFRAGVDCEVCDGTGSVVE